jgi:hypothetical protein
VRRVLSDCKLEIAVGAKLWNPASRMNEADRAESLKLGTNLSASTDGNHESPTTHET